MADLNTDLEDFIEELIFEFRDASFTKDHFCYHLDYQSKVYRQNDLAKLIADSVPHFALTPEEFEKYYKGEIISAKRTAWTRISTAMATKKGDYGELLLYLLLSYKIKPSIPRFVTKVRLRSSTSTQIHGFDCAHFTLENDELCLWLGEAKLHQSISTAVSGAITSLKDHCQAGYLLEELKILGSNIEANKRIPEDHIKKLHKALTKGRSLDRINFKIPVLLTYDSKAVGNHEVVCESLKKEITSEILKYIKNWTNSATTPLPPNFTILLFFMPFHNVGELKKKLDSIEEANR